MNRAGHKNGKADGDVSFEIGCHGSATVQASTVASGGTPPVLGFSNDTIANAPTNAFSNHPDHIHQGPGRHGQQRYDQRKHREVRTGYLLPVPGLSFWGSRDRSSDGVG